MLELYVSPLSHIEAKLHNTVLNHQYINKNFKNLKGYFNENCYWNQAEIVVIKNNEMS